MHDLRTREAEITEGQTDSMLRWGGLAGILGSLLMFVTFGVVAAFVGMDITAEESLTTFPDIRAARTVENSLYLGTLLLWIVHSLGLYRALRRTSPTAALIGTVLSILGLTLLTAGALPHVATAPLSELYQASGATAQDQAALVLMSHGIHATFNALLYTGLVILPLGLLALGTAMIGAPAYGSRFGMPTLALGLVGLAAATAVVLGFTAMAALGVLALVGFHLILGRQTIKLAASGSPTTIAGRMTETCVLALVSANRLPFSRSARCGYLHSEAIAMHPAYQLDLHHERARSLQRHAHQRRLLADAARQPSNKPHLPHWREVLGMRIVRAGLRLEGGSELPLDQLRRLPQPDLAVEATYREGTPIAPRPIT